ncbi:MAG: NHL repeat-containing protein [Acidobacteriota bacterium]|nr:NHL repeat-containing protein [Acidobacteriota bacterium]
MKFGLWILFSLLAIGSPKVIFADDFLGRPDFVLGREDDDENQIFHKLADIALSPQDQIYILDSGNGRIQVFDLQGRFVRTFGAEGQGPGEFDQPESMAFFGNQLWVADRNNGRIQVFENDKFLHSLTTDKPASIANLAVIGDEMFASNRSVFSGSGGIVALDREGAPLRHIDAHNDAIKGPMASMWNTVTLASLSGSRLLVAYRFNNVMRVFDKQGKLLAERNMEHFYDRYEAKRGHTIIPTGYAITSVCEGPAGNIYVVACDNEKRQCGRILILNPGLTGIVGKSIRDEHIWKLKFFPKVERWVVMKSAELSFFHAGS